MPLPKKRDQFTLEDVGAKEYFIVHHTPMGMTNEKVEELLPTAKREQLRIKSDTLPNDDKIRELLSPMIIEWNLPDCSDENIDDAGFVKDKTVLPVPSESIDSWKKIAHHFSEYIVMQLLFSISDALVDYSFFMEKRNASSITSLPLKR